MRSRRALTFFGMTVCMAAGAAWSCASFDGTPLPEGAGGGEAGASDAPAASDAFVPDAPVLDAAPDAPRRSPCVDGGAVVLESHFANDAGEPTLVGWATPPTLGEGASMTAEATDAGAVARGVVGKGNTTDSYAVILNAVLTPHAAVRFSFRPSELAQLYVYHQDLGAPDTAENIALSLQNNGWTFGTAAERAVVGPAGIAGQWHTLTYRLDSVGGDAGTSVHATLDQNIEVSLEVGDGASMYSTIQLGPFWPAPTVSSPPLSVAYADVTVWDCSK